METWRHVSSFSCRAAIAPKEYMMELKQLRYFMTLAQSGNMTSASRSLYITQQALSKAILKLEEELEAPLFERTQQGMRLTEYGKCLLPHARKVIRCADAAAQAIADMKNTREHVIHMGYVTGSFHAQSAVPPSLITQWEGKQEGISVFAQEYPQEELIRLILEEEIDIAYSVDPEGFEMEGLSRAVLTEEPLCLLISSALLNGRTSLTPQELEELPILNWRIGINPSEHFEELCLSAGFRPKMLYFNGSFSQCVEHARMEEGVMIAGLSYCRSVRSEGLEVLPFPSDEAKMRHVLFWKTGKDHVECIQRLIRYIRKNHAILSA